ncbi:sulfite oxidase [Spirosoma sp. BT702]|uniref:Sulfite oxidase n=1 Tax=Spirosoma profusum TaxID=2771354 RepID=A0A927APT8_9BACT|nr:sulfite oxidase [Spirosoma profusum]MBD2699043.1 sulfite oxidase [Spirosoma profusum]
MISNFHDRRGFLQKSVLAALSVWAGTDIAFADKIPQHYVPLAFDYDPLKDKVAGMKVLGDKPWNVESPIHFLDDAVTPVEKMFIRNNGLIPSEPINPATWTLTINGESVKAPKTYSLADLKKRFTPHTYQLVLECGGNGRSGFEPQTTGNPWDQGAVSCAEWTGVRLKDILADVGLKDDAVYIGYYGKDPHLSQDPTKVAISRGVPIKKALENETLIAWAVNGKDIPLAHGYPLRLVIGGWPASVSGKWLHTIAIRNKEHDGAKMEGHSYRLPIRPVQPGEKLAETPENFRIIESMPVKSLITYPQTGAMFDVTKSLALRGHAWAGDRSVAEVHTSIDYGATWQKANVATPKNRLAWQHWNANINFPKPGYYEVWVRATDSSGASQPMVIPQWNPGGYLNNACHRIAIKAT